MAAHLNVVGGLIAGGAFVTLGAIVLLAVGRLPRRGRYWLLQSAAQAVFTAAFAVNHLTPMITVCGTASACFFLLWWNSDDSDDFKRRLRNLKKKFTAVRRTAPATA